MFKLVIQDDEGKTTVVPLIRDEITIGRKEGNTIRLTERNVSRRHARILRNNGEVQIEDLGSYNGIRVNNARIAERVSLRVSDQVQIGDYKLYLKAEGVEQVDDARTMPIERIDSVTATEVMPAVANSAPTAPVPVQTPPAPAATAAAINRSNVATADTDPAGRPVATAAQVNAVVNPQTGYGKLVVVSSNFAGKEFDLTRPQMIIGRTDENDLVINHRSISRNHAKVTRDPETSRYTISDLQSSNGVRVNGQDYGKVELRRGDTVDLGHVRLRFVEPGEDFVFARDAVIADVPEAGGKRGMLVAIILAVVVLGAVGAFFALKGGPKDTKVADPGSGSTGKIENGGGSGGSSIEVVATGGSDGSAQSMVTPPIDAPDAAVVTNNDTETRGECLRAQTDRKWPDLRDCANKLAKTDPAAAKVFLDKAKTEANNSNRLDKLNEEIKNRSLAKAQKILNSIEDGSVYKNQAQTMYDQLEQSLVDDAKRTAKALAAKHKCTELDTLASQSAVQGQAVVDAVRSFKCEPLVATVDHTPITHNNGNNGSAATQVTPPVACDAQDLAEKGRASINVSAYAAALASFEASLKCKKDPTIYKMAFLAACQANVEKKARLYYNLIGASQVGSLIQACIRNHIDPRIP